MRTVTAIAHPNIALVKYWGKRDHALNLPATPSLSMTVDRYHTRTTLGWGAPQDAVVLGGREASAGEAARVLRFLDLIALQTGEPRPPCAVESENNFPTAAGLASSSSAFAALALAAVNAAGLSRSPEAISALARRGSGSACRSLWGGWVVWGLGERADGEDSHGEPVAPADHWDLRLVVAMISSGPKATGSTAGMIRTEETSPLYPGWVTSAGEDLAAARGAVLARDLEALGEVMERSALKMHATMLGARPPLRYWRAETVAVMDSVEALRREGVGAWYTMDAGPNVKVLCRPEDAPRVASALASLVPAVDVLGVGGDPTVLQ